MSKDLIADPAMIIPSTHDMDARIEDFLGTTDISHINTHDQRHSGIKGSAQISSFDFSMEDDMSICRGSGLRPDLASTEESTADLLDFDFEMASLENLVETRDGLDIVQGSGNLETSSPKLPAVPLEHSLIDASSLDPEFGASTLLRSPPPPTTLLSGPHSRSQSCVLYEPSAEDDVSFNLVGASSQHRRSSVTAGSYCSSTACKCMQKVLSLHEEVETEATADSLSSVDYRLGFQKTILSRCNEILGCKNCRRNSAMAMLMVTICERLLRSFQHISRNCLDKLQYQQQRQYSDFAFRRMFIDEKELGGYQKISIGVYSAESPHEQTLLLMRVVELQLISLRGLLIQLKDLAQHSGWKKHIPMLQPVDEEAKRTILSLRENANEVLDGTSRDPLSRASLFERRLLGK